MDEYYANRPSMRDAIAPDSHGDEERVVQYLESAPMLLDCLGGETTDCLDPADRTMLEPHVMTDGVWVWRHDLAHYVRKYHLRLPAAFVDHMRARDWHPPEIANDELVALADQIEPL
jgi:hypothetical protein